MKLVEQAQIAAGFVPVDMAAGANNGDWISLKDYNHLTILFYKAAGASGEPPTITVQQATDNAGAGAKALNFTEVWTKNNADVQTVGQFTKVTQAAANTYALAAGNTQAIVAIEIDGDMLDVDGGFDHVRATVADVGITAQVGCILYILSQPRFAEATPPSAL
jgi:hypothetical protein